ncbi:proline iminopeptidase-family hydrolase [bacterium]|nr:proline iminopeptidase-family hydrolase [bacterium]
MKKIIYLFLMCIMFLYNCIGLSRNHIPTLTDYFDYSGRDDILFGGVKSIPITTPKGTFRVWTKRIGNNPRIKVLLLHGGPGGTHEYFQCFDSYFPKAGFEYYYYDQLGSYYSDQPRDSTLWELERFVEEVEQVRKALNLDKENFYLYGHSWGGLLAIEYALKYQDNLKGLIISNMMTSAPEYEKYANEVLAKQMDPNVLAEIRTIEANNDFDNPKYMELLQKHYYSEHFNRLPSEKKSEYETRPLNHLNFDVYTLMQGPSEFGIGGKLADWDRTADLHKIKVPTLTIGARYDTMDPEHMEWMSKQIPQGKFLYCPTGSHLTFLDDQETYFEGLIKFIREVDNQFK